MKFDFFKNHVFLKNVINLLIYVVKPVPVCKKYKGEKRSMALINNTGDLYVEVDFLSKYVAKWS